MKALKKFFTRKATAVVGLLLLPLFLSAQKVTIEPSITPALFTYNQSITVTYDVSNTSLSSLSDAWIWVWIPNKNTNATYNVNPATSAQSAAKFTKSTANGKTTFSLTFKPSDFFSGDISKETQMGILLKASDWSGGQTSDKLLDFWSGLFEVKITKPSQPLMTTLNATIPVEAQTPTNATFTLYVNDVLKDTQSGIKVYTYSLTADVAAGATVRIDATDGTNNASVSFQYLISSASTTQARPKGIIAGINYGSDATQVTLCLWNPYSNYCYVQGDFSNWKILPQNKMYRDGEYFWITLTGLTAGQEYGFNYYDGKVFIADPYADKILDPDDQYIPTTTYPNLKTFPTAALRTDWYNNRVSVFQTNQTPYTWQATNYTKPAADKLVIYELLIRDFFGDQKRSYQSLIDTLSYFKKLGVNAIELMPITEFNGNDSWGYNPTFMFAADKYYGSKNKLKEFIDTCHKNNIAVIMDMVLNQQDLPCPFLMMAFDFTATPSPGKPASYNQMFNVAATHPYNVFFDVNHESKATQKWVDSVNYHWINEYKIDGIRYDLSKGFTQKNSGGDVNAWSAKDASRIAILNRMYDKIRTYSSDTYLILEHFADNAEETELATKGFMLWGNMNWAFKNWHAGQGASLSSLSYKNRSFTTPSLVHYMESHDEERVMYNSLQNGTTGTTYNAKDLNTALNRMSSAVKFFYAVPGPKMLWQFGELGYDYSINTCANGSISNDCRVGAKPVKWDYLNVTNRKNIYNTIAGMMTLRKNSVFSTTDFTIDETSNIKQVMLRNSPYTATPTTAAQMNVVVAANLTVQDVTATVRFPHTGAWYDYFGTTMYTITNVETSMTLNSGDAIVFTDVAFKEYLAAPVATAFTNVTNTGFTANWNTVSGATGYYLDVATDNQFTQMLSAYTNKNVGNVTSLAVVGQIGRIYYYRVRAYNSSATSGNSNVIGNVVTSIEQASELQLYPNPAAESVKISSMENVTAIELINAAGQRFTPRFLSEGEINLQGLPSGVYILRIEYQGKTVSFKIIH